MLAPAETVDPLGLHKKIESERAKKNLIELFIKHGVIKVAEEGKLFKLKGAAESRFYFQKDTIFENPQLFNKLIDLLIPVIYENKEPEKTLRIVGQETGGAKMATNIACQMGRLKLKGVLSMAIKKESKGYGSEKEMPPRLEEETLVIVEDVFTTGGSVIQVYESLEKQGVTPSMVVCVVKRDDVKEMAKKQTENIKELEDAGVKVVFLFDSFKKILKEANLLKD